MTNGERNRCTWYHNLCLVMLSLYFTLITCSLQLVYLQDTSCQSNYRYTPLFCYTTTWVLVYLNFRCEHNYIQSTLIDPIIVSNSNQQPTLISYQIVTLWLAVGWYIYGTETTIFYSHIVTQYKCVCTWIFCTHPNIIIRTIR